MLVCVIYGSINCTAKAIQPVCAEIEHNRNSYKLSLRTILRINMWCFNTLIRFSIHIFKCYYDQIFTSWFFRCNSMKEWKRCLPFANTCISSRDIQVWKSGSQSEWLMLEMLVLQSCYCGNLTCLISTFLHALTTLLRGFRELAKRQDMSRNSHN